MTYWWYINILTLPLIDDFMALMTYTENLPDATLMTYITSQWWLAGRDTKLIWRFIDDLPNGHEEHDEDGKDHLHVGYWWEAKHT